MNLDTVSIARSNKPTTMDLVCFSHLPWDFVYQRPQHLLSRCQRERRVFYFEEPMIAPGNASLTIRKDTSGVQIVVPQLPPDLNEEETRAMLRVLVDQLFLDQEIENYILWYYTPMAVGFTRQLKPALIIYDCMDELSAFKDAPVALTHFEDELFQKAHLVFTGGNTLYESKRNRHTNIHPFPSSIDAKHFSMARASQTEPVDQAKIPHPRLGFFGVIDERMDLDLLGELARRRPEWQLVFLGPVVKIDPETLPKSDNIHYLGMKSYPELPAYLAGWDVALLPFAVNESTRFISPTKIPEYLSGGKPVVSAPIQDVIHPYGDEKLVIIADGLEEFEQGIVSHLSTPKNRSAWLAKVDKFLSKNSWDYTWAQMMQLIESSLYMLEKERKEQDHKDSKKRIPESSLESIPVGINSLDGGSAYLDRNRPFDYLIVGAGFAGSVLAERLAVGSGKKILLIDRRPHIAGNAYDHYNEDGVLIHRYGPHIFHTNSKEVFAYLSRFTEWRPYEHHVLASVDGQLLPIPINLDTINQLYGTSLTSFELEKFYASVSEPREKILTSEDVVVNKVGRELYEKFFRNYTRKQWDLDPSELDASVTARVPVRMNRDNRYFTDAFQSMPLQGYTRMFERMLDHPNIKVMLNTDYQDVVDLIPFQEIIFTGPIDEYYNYCYGKLPYRSLHFEFKTFDQAVVQPEAVINYPNHQLYTRSTEFKYLTGQVHPKSTLVYEYPQAEGDPYYPIPRQENAELYARYQQLANNTPGVYFAGRLGTYKYYNMDQVVGQAITLYSKTQEISRGEAVRTFTPRVMPVQVGVKAGNNGVSK